MISLSMITALPILILTSAALRTVQAQTFTDAFLLRFFGPDNIARCSQSLTAIYYELYPIYAEELAEKSSITVEKEFEIDPSLKSYKKLMQLAATETTADGGNVRRRQQRMLQDEQHQLQKERELPSESWCNNYCPSYLYLQLGCPRSWCTARRLKDEEDEFSNGSMKIEQGTEAVAEERKKDGRDVQEVPSTSTSTMTSPSTSSKTSSLICSGSRTNIGKGPGSKTASNFYALVDQYVTDERCKHALMKMEFEVISIQYSV